MDIYLQDASTILVSLATEESQLFKSFTLADVPGYPDDLQTSLEYVRLETINNPDRFFLLTEPVPMPEFRKLDLSDKPTAAKHRLKNLPGWAMWTGEEAATFLRDNILAGMTEAEALEFIDSKYTEATTVAEIQAVNAALIKHLVKAIIAGRDIGHQNEARAIMYLRDIMLNGDLVVK